MANKKYKIIEYDKNIFLKNNNNNNINNKNINNKNKNNTENKQIGGKKEYNGFVDSDYSELQYKNDK